MNKLFETSAGLDKAHEDLKKRLKEQAKNKDNDPLHQYAIQRTNDLKDAIKDLRIEIDYENEYQQAVAQANLERERALKQIVIGSKERAAIEEKYRTDIEKAEKDHADKLEDIWRETAAIRYETSHSAFEKEIYDIEQWKNKALEDLGEYKDAIGDKNKWIEEAAAITANALAKEAKAFEDEIDRINGKVQSLAEKVFEQEADERQKALYKLAKEISEYADEGIYDPALIQRYANNALKDIDANLKVDLAFDKSGLAHLQLPDEVFNLFDNMQAYLERERAFAEQMLKPPALSNLEKLQPKFDALQPEIDLSNLQRQLSTLEGEPLKFKANLDAIGDNINQSLTISTSYFENAISTAANAATSFANVLADSVQKINAENFSPFLMHEEQPNFKIPTPNIKDFFPKIDIDFSKINAPLDKITGKLAELTNIAGSIAQDVSKRQKQNINVTISPNISVDLGGAYVFDNAMKAQLTDDITTEVANAITQAVNQGIGKLNLSIAN